MLRWVKDIPNDGIIRFRGFFNADRLMLTGPKSLQEVLSQKSYDFEKPHPVRHFLGKILGDGLILVEGAEHKFQRKNLTPAFHVRHIKELYPCFWDTSRLMVECISKEITHETTAPTATSSGSNTAVVEMGEWASRATMDIIGVAGMGRATGALLNPDDEMITLFSELLEPTKDKMLYFAVNLVLPDWMVRMLPWKLNADLDRMTSGLRRIGYDLIKEKRLALQNKEADGVDILSVIMKENAFSDDTIVNQLLTFLGAG
jgi:cytochrome P450